MGNEYIEPAKAGARRRNVGLGERRLSLLGGVLAALAGIWRGGVGGAALGGLGAALAYRGASGHCPINQRLGRNTAGPHSPGLLQGLFGGRQPRELVLRAAVHVDRDAAGLYEVWRDCSRLPEFMPYLVEVSAQGQKVWHWVADVPSLGKIAWDTRLTVEVPGRRLAWRSVEGSVLDTEGEVDFRGGELGERGCDVLVEMRYRLGDAMGARGDKMARAVNVETLQEGLERFKQIVEAGDPSRQAVLV